MKKRIISILLTTLLVVSLLPVTAMAAEAPLANYTTDENFRMAYNLNSYNGNDFIGFVNDAWQQITYNKGGFKIGIYNNNGLTWTATPEFVADGQAIQMTYTVTNDTTSPVSNFRFYLAADTAIGGDNHDDSLNTVQSDGSGEVVLMDNKCGINLFALSTTEGGTAVPTAYSDGRSYPSGSQYGPWDPDWVSYCDLVDSNNVDPSTVHPIEETMDSAFVMYFPLTTLQPGESAEYNFVIGMGSSETIQDIIKQVRAALGLVDYKNEKITGLDPNTTYIFEYKEGETEQPFEIDSNGNGEVSLSGKDKNQKDYNFIGRNVKYWEKTGSEEQAQELEINGRPQTPSGSEILPGNEQYAKPEDVLVDTVTETSVKIIPVKGQQYQYSTDSGTTWMAVPESGEITELTAGSTIQIRTRIAATEETFASEYSEAVIVTLKTAVKTLEGFSAKGYIGIADGQAHSITVTVPEGATVMYSEAVNAAYTTTNPEHTASGEYTVYYRVTKDGCYPAYGSEKVVIIKTTIDYAAETVALDEGYEISTKNGTGSGNTFADGKLTPDQNKKVTLEPNKTYYVRKAASGSAPASEAVELVIPARPTAPTESAFTKTEETVQNKKDGSFSGITAKMEYKKGDGDWTSGPATLNGLSNETVKVRVKATNAAFKSEEYSYTFTASTAKLTVTMGETSQQYAYGAKVVKPADPTKTGYTFGGWYSDEECTQAWNFAIDTVKDDMNLYPKWIRNYVPITTIGGKVFTGEQGDTPVSDATVELYLGTVKVAATVTDTNGVYSFDSVENGTYNIVVTKNNKTRTEMVTVNTAGTFEKEVELPNKAVSSVVEHTGEEIANAKSDISKTVVGGLDEIADDIAKNTSVSGTDKVTIKLTVEPKAESEVTGASDIKALAGSGKKVEFLDLSLWMQTNSENPVDIGSDNDELLTIVIPFDFTGVDVGSVMILRKHGSGNAEKLAASPNEFGEKIEINEAAGTITLYAMKFSDYAVAYSNASHGVGSYTPGHTVTSDLKSVTKVTIDGKVVDSRYYTVSGGTVYLTGEFMKTLANGKHTVKLYDGLKVATGTITVTGNMNVVSAATGDMGVALYAGLAISSLLGMGWVGKKKHDEE